MIVEPPTTAGFCGVVGVAVVVEFGPLKVPGCEDGCAVVGFGAKVVAVVFAARAGVVAVVGVLPEFLKVPG